MRTNHKINVIINDKPYLVEVDDPSTSPLTVKVNGRTYQVNIEELAETAPTVETARPQAIQKTMDPRPDQVIKDSVTAVVAPMPGNIVDISVGAGDHVSADQVLCLLEAMKMQNAIRSPRSGIIAQVTVSLGQAVAYGDVLFTFE